MSAKVWLAAVMAVLATTPALARRDRGDRESRPAPPVQEQRQPNFPSQDLQPPARSQGDAKGRYFSPEERRKLRRDINEAGRDIYHTDRPGR